MAEIVMVKISELRGTPYNPKARVETKIGRLAKSIQKVGLIYPILVNAKYVVIDGNRRLTACKTLGWKEVPVSICENEDSDGVYAEVNSTSRSMAGIDSLEIWLSNPKAVTPCQAKRYAKMESELGRGMLEQLVERRLGPRTYKYAKAICKFIGWSSAADMKETMDWLMAFGFYRHLEIAMSSGGLRADQLADCITKGKALKLRMTAVEK